MRGLIGRVVVCRPGTVLALIVPCESVQTHSHLPITFIEAFQGIPVPHRAGTPGASLRSGVGHTGTPM
eukprot:7294763-Prymnesium_polylepis.1